MDFWISKIIATTITTIVGKTTLITGLKSKLNAIAPPIRDNISNDKPKAIPKNIFLPNVAFLVEPKMKSIANKIIAISVIGLISRLYNSTSKILDLNLLSDKNWICLIMFQVVSSSGSFFKLSIRS